jgi:hypothetical protein
MMAMQDQDTASKRGRVVSGPSHGIRQCVIDAGASFGRSLVVQAFEIVGPELFSLFANCQTAKGGQLQFAKAVFFRGAVRDQV